MKKGIHQELVTCSVKCACGNEFEIKSTKEKISLDVCGACHPAYTGEKRKTAATGRVEQFNKKYNRNK